MKISALIKEFENMPCKHGLINTEIFFNHKDVNLNDLGFGVVEVDTIKGYILIEKVKEIDENGRFILEFEMGKDGSLDFVYQKIFGKFYIKCKDCGLKYE